VLFAFLLSRGLASKLLGSLGHHVLVHEGRARHVSSQGDPERIVVIEREIEGIGHEDGENAGFGHNG
jgi:hypothetical protein